MSNPLEPTQPKPLPKLRKRRWWRWPLASVLALSPAILTGAWFALPQMRPMMTGAVEQAWEIGSATVSDLSSRLMSKPAVIAPDKVRGVRVMTVRLTEQSAEKRFTGVVAARYETQVGFRVSGKIATRQVELGQSVLRGQVLMRLDPADYEAALRAAEANLAAALAQESQAIAEEKRQKRLLAQGWTTRAVYDRILAAARNAEEQVKAAQEQAELARNTLSYAQLTAPENGIITAIGAEAGQVVPQGQPVLTFVRPGDREAVIAVPEGQISDLGEWSAKASLWSQGDRTEPAILREVSPQADTASRTHTARFSLPEGAKAAELGATVTLTLRQKMGEPAITVPASAVFFKKGQPSVWRIGPSTERLEAIPVSILQLGAERTVLSGLNDGDRIVTLGVHRLDEGLTVRVIEDVSLATVRP
jgi:membrane fusion protein, multidrug efflux system